MSYQQFLVICAYQAFLEREIDAIKFWSMRSVILKPLGYIDQWSWFYSD